MELKMKHNNKVEKLKYNEMFFLRVFIILVKI